MNLDTDYALVMLTVVGNAGNDLLVMKPDKWPARIPKKHLYLIDPDDTDICIPASLADNNLIQRCDDAPITFAWAMRYLIEAVPLVPFKQPARPAMQIDSSKSTTAIVNFYSANQPTSQWEHDRRDQILRKLADDVENGRITIPPPEDDT